MKALLNVVLVSCALVAPALSFAQTVDQPVTRAQVRADLVQVERAGYRPVASDAQYPADIQTAEAKVFAERTSNATSVGGVSMNGSSQSGAPASADRADRIYFGH
ncbi:DUF4148 domain-containing protein [Paraburkholderia phenoliruptrix]|uniref:Purine nucleoside phosphorylase n=2 Tax=Paraburkholderia phenoliruptrix TaxID=252970 RepID=K0DQL3_9BURK|nr:DUF4148 domain-containing protein [Paraburkholderia phenoliruptrix]AFT88441.1 hypothetical protein BUPH_00987 [Paraburkholderia phenoliruptrix BR3459a]CAB4047369.1 hypothetical protein LMG9964_01001 [Paraburkholderia phenoliruptrix]